ncbi:MAG: hypothetical protein F6K31_17870 [Symploca sp. SIO2G7]|nr:hypothetical protein [Symploca sp. SIO2G7]
MKELPQRKMLSALIEKLKEESEICLYRLEPQTLWSKFESGDAHFVVRNSEIVGCGIIWDDLRQLGKEPAYAELGTVWTQKQDRTSILAELGDNIPRIAKGKKIMGFCRELKQARYFRKSPLFPVNKIANQKTSPTDLIELIPQFRGWSNNVSTHKLYEPILYYEDDGQITSWYLVYES